MAITASVRARLTLVAAGVAVLVASVTAGLGYVINDLTRTTRDLERLASRMAAVDRLQRELAGLLGPVNDYLLTEDASRRDAFDRSLDDLGGLVVALQHDRADTRWQAVTRDVHAGVTQLGALAAEVLFVEHPAGNPRAIQVMSAVTRLSDEVNAAAAGLRALVDADLNERRGRAATQSTAAARLLIALAIALPVGLALAAALILRWVMAPLRSLSRGVEAVISQEEARVPVQGRDEVGMISRAVNELADRLAVWQREARRRSLQLETLEAAGQAFRQVSSRDEAYRTLVAFACSATEAAYGVAAVFNDHGQVVHMVESGVPPIPDQTPEDRQAFIAGLPSGHRPLRIDAGERWAHRSGLPGAVRAALVAPVASEAGARAHLYVFGPASGTFSDADEDAVARITHDAAQAMRLISLREEAERLSTIDGLTGFLNREAFEHRLTEECRVAARHGRPFALVFIDVDNLKAINQQGGHPAGDAAIRRCCDAIRSVTRTTDVAGRYGGDELLVLFPETTLKDAMAAAQRILRRVASLPLTVAQERLTLSASLGVAAYPQHGRDKESLLRAVDFALFQAKATGRGCVHAVKPLDDASNSAEAA